MQNTRIFRGPRRRVSFSSILTDSQINACNLGHSIGGFFVLKKWRYRLWNERESTNSHRPANILMYSLSICMCCLYMCCRHTIHSLFAQLYIVVYQFTAISRSVDCPPVFGGAIAQSRVQSCREVRSCSIACSVVSCSAITLNRVFGRLIVVVNECTTV